MGFLEDRYTRIVRKYDPKLKVIMDKGIRRIVREITVPVKYNFDGIVIVNFEKSLSFVTALTRDWTVNTENVEWGELPILKRLSNLDFWNKESYVNQLEKIQQKEDEVKQKDIRNKSEDFAREFHSSFKKTFSDVNVSNMKKIDKRRNKGA